MANETRIAEITSRINERIEQYERVLQNIHDTREGLEDPMSQIASNLRGVLNPIWGPNFPYECLYLLRDRDCKRETFEGLLLDALQKNRAKIQELQPLVAYYKENPLGSLAVEYEEKIRKIEPIVNELETMWEEHQRTPYADSQNE